MDTYGLISLTALDRMIDRHQKKIIELNVDEDHELIMLHAARLAALVEIKELCLKLPSAQQLFEQGMFIERRGCGYGEEDFLNANAYITQHTKSDKS